MPTIITRGSMDAKAFGFAATATSSGPYTINNSLRFRKTATAYLNRTFGTPTSSTVYTWSGWVKRGVLAASAILFGTGTNTSLNFTSGDAIALTINGSTAVTTTALFRDPSAWYHIVYTQNGSAQTIYVNGSSVGTGTTANIAFNTAVAHQIGEGNSTNYFDGELAEINFIDGQALTPTSFGAYDSNGIWQPIQYTGTYGNNGFHLTFGNTTSTTTLGYDTSGNSNNWTTNNISLTAGVTYDAMIDTPSVVSATVSNYCVLNPVNYGTVAPTEGNLTLTQGTAAHTGVVGTIQLPTSGKFYWEVTVNTLTSSSVAFSWGVATSAASLTSAPQSTTGTYVIYVNASKVLVTNGATGSTGTGAISAGAVVQVAYDAGSGNLWLGLSNVWYNSTLGTTGNPSSGTNQTLTVAASLGLFPYATCDNETIRFNFGQQPFTYTAPTGFVALNTYNLPTPTILNGANYMAATLYTGTGATLSVNNSNNNKSATSFQPDFVWLKSRSAATNNELFNINIGATKFAVSNSTNSQQTDATSLTSFNSNGFTLGTSSNLNTNTATYDAWQWLASNTTTSNTSGSLTSTVSVNNTAGFSVVTYSAAGGTPTVGHGLGAVPNFMIVKSLTDSTSHWCVYTTITGAGNYIQLETTAASVASTSVWNNTAPTSTVFSVGDIKQTTDSNMQAYCWTAIPGYSSFGSYTGNASTNGPFVYLGFRPRYLLVKRTDSTSDWYIWDSSRSPNDVVSATLLADSSAAETSATSVDFLSNGFKCRSATVVNVSAGTYIYAAFAENPFTISRAV